MVFKQLPRKVRVKRKSYKVKYPTELVCESRGELHGAVTFRDKLIEIAKDEDLEEMESTIIHELLHALSHEYRLGLKEDKVIKIEKALYQLFKDNGWKIVKK